MKVLVTGGCGYIGSHVARAFKMNGDTVFIIDRVSRRHTLNDIDDFFIGDFASIEGLAAIAQFVPDVIVHCAGTSLVGPSMTDPGEYYANNIAKTIMMLNFIKDQPTTPVVLFSSSASVYGTPETVPVNEDATIQPISPYGSTKAMTEQMLSDYYNAYGMSSMCFRYFNAAGAMPITHDLGQEPEATHIIARVLEASLVGKAFTVNGEDYDTPDGTCVRDYIHVWDIAIAHLNGVRYMIEDNHKGAFVFNLGTNIGTSNKQITDYVFGKYGLPFVNFGEARPGDPANLVADATLANETLGWTPIFSDLETIIDSAYQWYCRS